VTEAEVRSKLKAWILEHTKSAAPIEFTDDTSILEKGLLSSLDIVEFVLYIEHLRDEEVDMDDIDPDVFTSIDTLHQAFFA
jgi:acyl carrier protein